MLVETRPWFLFAVTVAWAAACGDDRETFVDASSNDAASNDAVETTDGGDVDATPADAAPGMPDGGPILPDAAMIPDAVPQAAMWRGAAMIETLSGSAQVPIVGMDGAGRAIVAWRNQVTDPTDETRSYGEIRVNHFDPETGWGTGMAMTPPPTSDVFAHNFHLAVNASGEAMLLWYQHHNRHGTSADVMAQRFTPTGGWLPPTVLYATEEPTDASGKPRVAIAADGTAIAAWSQRDGLDSQLYVRRFVPASGWEPSLLLHAPESQDAIAEDLAMDDSGGAVLVWAVRTGGSNIWGSRFTPGGGWSAPARIDDAAATEGATQASFARVAVDRDGDAVVALQANGGIASVWAVVAPSSGAWQPATRLDVATAYASDPAVAVDAAGNAIVTWKSAAGGQWDGVADVRARTFAPGAGWSTVATLDASEETAQPPHLAMLPGGIATAAWSHPSGGVWARRFVPGAGWGTAAPISSTTTGVHGEPSVAAGGVDSAVVVWPHDTNLWTNVYR